MGMDFRGLVWKRVWIIYYILWSEIGSGFEELGGTPLARIPRSTPPRSEWRRNWINRLHLEGELGNVLAFRIELKTDQFMQRAFR